MIGLYLSDGRRYLPFQNIIPPNAVNLVGQFAQLLWDIVEVRETDASSSAEILQEKIGKVLVSMRPAQPCCEFGNTVVEVGSAAVIGAVEQVPSTFLLFIAIGAGGEISAEPAAGLGSRWRKILMPACTATLGTFWVYSLW